MPRYRLDLAYDGTDFYGWQLQPNHRSVQEVLQQTIQRITGESAAVMGSGRTDQGVHARGQVAHFDLAKPFAARDLHKALNALLPEDVKALRTRRVAADFHAQFGATRKEYRYFIWNDPVLNPLERRFRAHVRRPLDVAAMRAAAAHLVGEHDFAAFTANPNRVVETTVREVLALTVVKRGPLVTIRAVGRGFLYRMVRSVAGFLIRVGEGAVPPDEAVRILVSRTRTARVPTAPPEGLFLWRVSYA
jgi:tRNA pseudouridine38-40 synthase